LGTNSSARAKSVVTPSVSSILCLNTRRTATSHPRTQLFLLFLFALALQNVGELFMYYSDSPRDGLQWLFGGYVFISASLIALAVFIHFVLVTVRDRSIGGITIFAVYAPMSALQFLLWTTPYLVQGCEPHGFTWTRIPGPLYPVLAVWALAGLTLSLSLLRKYASNSSASVMERTRARWIFYSALPMIILPMVVLGLQAVGVNKFNMVLFFPLAVTIFLVLSAYATYEHRLFDIDLFIPWSKLRKRSTAFHRRIQDCISALDQTKGVQDSLGTISRVLQCPLAIVSQGDPVVAGGPAAFRMTTMPEEFLHANDDFVVQREVATVDPGLGEAMKAHNISAMARFQSPGKDRVGWLLVGDVIDERLHSPKDFRYVENLFDRLGKQFLDEVSDLQGQLTSLKAQVSVRDAEITELRSMVAELTSALSDVRELELAKVRSTKAEEFDIDSLVKKLVGPVVTYVGRDRSIADELKSRFPVVQTFVSVTSKKYAARQSEDILIAHGSSIAEIKAARAESERPRMVIAWGYDLDKTPVDISDEIFHPVETKADGINVMSTLFEQNRDASLNLDDLSTDFEKRLLVKTLERCNGSQAAAAKALGIAQNTLHYKLSRYGLLKQRPKKRVNRKR